jgi:hypothetical protein
MSVRWVFLSAVIMGSVVAGAFIARELGLLPKGGEEKATPVATPAAPRPEAPATKEKIEEATAVGSHRAQLALAKVKQREALAQVNVVKSVVADALDVSGEFEERLTSLLRDDRGRIIAADPQLISCFNAVSGADRPTRSEVERLAANFRDYIAPLQASVGDSLDATLPSEEILRELDVIRDRADKALEAYRNALEQLDEIVAEAGVSGKEPTAKPLAEVLAELRREEVRRETARLEEAREKARMEAEAEKARVIAEKEAEVQKAALEAEVARKERDRKRTLAEDPAIQAKFQPFLAKGRWLFDRDAYSRISAPASYARLLDQGYLNNFESFARGMAGWTNFRRSYSPGDGFYTDLSDRPRHKMPTTEAEWVEMKALYEQFKELAPVWVEMELLNK